METVTPNTFTVVNDEILCAAIDRTQESLAYVAPGISKRVVEALERSLRSRPDLQITVIVDLDPEVYRLGYGTEEGLRALQGLGRQQHLALRQQAGLRIGLLVTDDETLVYSPTPLLIEAGSTLEEKPNAIVITRGSDSTAALLAACGAQGGPHQDTPPPQEAEIGRKAATPEEITRSVLSLKEMPPKKFDVARIERIYESRIQFVELEVTGYRLSSLKAKIPADLLVGDDKGLRERLTNTFRLWEHDEQITVEIPELDPVTLKPSSLPGGGGLVLVKWSEAKLERQRRSLIADFLVGVPRFGQLILKAHRGRFDARLALLRAQVDDFYDAMHSELTKKLEASIDGLARTLLPRVKTHVPQRYLKASPGAPTDEFLLLKLQDDLRGSFPGSSHHFKPEIRCVFKDVTYETISDEGFKDALGKAFAKAGAKDLIVHSKDVVRRLGES